MLFLGVVLIVLILLAHEGGHIVASKVVRLRVGRMRFSIFSVSVHIMGLNQAPYIHRAFVLSAGVFVNFALALLLSFLAQYVRVDWLQFVQAASRAQYVVHEPTAYTGVLGYFAGPIGMWKDLQISSLFGFHGILDYAARISFGLAVVNLAPLPILDGGKLAVLVMEACRQRKLSARASLMWNGLGTVPIMLFVILVWAHDIFPRVLVF